jgi:D-alanyl-D-alanine carboxypeptidase (penicillin-binding protein 5/6)
MTIESAIHFHWARRRSQPVWRVLMLVALIALLPVNAFATGGSSISTKARNAILMDDATGAVLFQQNADELAPPASMSKLMTLAVLFRSLKTGKTKLDDEFVMSEHAWRTGGAPSRTSAMMVPINTKTKVSELIQGIIVQSGNDACISVAEALAGSEEAFANMMTAEARRLGLKQSVFKNSTGLPDPGHLMTARELALLARHLIEDYPEYYPIFAQKEFPYRKHKFINRNPLLFLDIGADGLKTGFTKEAGYGLVGSAVRDGRRLIVVVNGLSTAEERKEESRKLLEWGFRTVTQAKLFDAGEVVGKARVWGGDRFYVPLTGDGELRVLLPRLPADQKLRAEIVYQGPLKPPIKKGDEVATLRITSSSTATVETPLYAMEDVAKAGLVRQGLDSLLHLAFQWIKL